MRVQEDGAFWERSGADMACVWVLSSGGRGLCCWFGGFGPDDSAPAGEVLCVEGCPVFPGFERVLFEEAAPAAWEFAVGDLVVAGQFVDCAHRAVQPLGDVFCCQVRGAAHGAGASVPGGGAPAPFAFCRVFCVMDRPNRPICPSGLFCAAGVAGRVGGCRGVSLGGCAGR